MMSLRSLALASSVALAPGSVSCSSDNPSASPADSGATTTPGGDGAVLTEAGGSPACNRVTAYVAMSSTRFSFASDIQPILTNGQTCGLGGVCHGEPPVALDNAMSKKLGFVGSAATVKATLLGPSVNAPSMKLVVPGNVGASMLAYKLSGLDGLACIQSQCAAHATTGTMTTCGDTMPKVGGMLSVADRTKILDWIAQGAGD